MFFSAERFKAVREARKMTKVQFAETLDVSAAYVSMIESGSRTPKDGVIRLFLGHHSVNVVWWETGEGEMFSTNHIPLMPSALSERIAEAQAEYNGQTIKLNREEFILVKMYRRLSEQAKEDLIGLADQLTEEED